MTGNEMDEHLGKSEQATELADEGLFIGLSEFLESEEITFSELQKSSKAFEQQFKTSIATIEIKPFNSDEPAYLTKVMELVPRLVDHRDRSFSRAIIAAVLARYGIIASKEHVSSLADVEEFIRKQTRFLDEKNTVMKSHADYGNLSSSEKKVIADAVVFEFNLLRLLISFVGHQSWFTAGLLVKALGNFRILEHFNKNYSFPAGILYFVQGKAAAPGVRFASLINEVSSHVEELQGELRNQRDEISRIHIKLKHRDEKIAEQSETIASLQSEADRLGKALSSLKDERETDRRISSVDQSDLKAHVNKSIAGLMRYEIKLISEMLSDGDEFNSRILKQVNDVKHKLEDLKVWLSSSG